MSTANLINPTALIDDAKGFELIRQHGWPGGFACHSCASPMVVRNGRDDSQDERRRYRCKSCSARFDDLSGTVLAGHHQPLRVWVLCPCFMGLNLSNLPIAKELGLNASDVPIMTTLLREGLTARAPQTEFSGTVEVDVANVVAGHKGHPDEFQRQRTGRRGRLKGASSRDTLEEKPPILGLTERGGRVVMRMLPDVQRKSIRPVIDAVVKAVSLVNMEDYNIDVRLPE